MRRFGYNTRNRFKKREARAGICEKKLLLKVKRHFRPAENSFCDEGALEENVLKENLRNMSSHNKEDKSFAQEVDTVNF